MLSVLLPCLPLNRSQLHSVANVRWAAERSCICMKRRMWRLPKWRTRGRMLWLDPWEGSHSAGWWLGFAVFRRLGCRLVVDRVAWWSICSASCLRFPSVASSAKHKSQSSTGSKHVASTTYSLRAATSSPFSAWSSSGLGGDGFSAAGITARRRRQHRLRFARGALAFFAFLLWLPRRGAE